jgi:hypothetical protein
MAFPATLVYANGIARVAIPIQLVLPPLRRMACASIIVASLRSFTSNALGSNITPNKPIMLKIMSTGVTMCGQTRSTRFRARAIHWYCSMQPSARTGSVSSRRGLCQERFGDFWRLLVRGHELESQLSADACRDKCAQFSHGAAIWDDNLKLVPRASG